MVDSYSFGRITIDNKSYTSDIILFPGRIFSPWWRKEGHHLCLKDLEEIPFADFEVFIVGTAFFGAMKVGKDVQAFTKEMGIRLIVEKTKNAVQTYNELAHQKSVVGAFHLTC